MNNNTNQAMPTFNARMTVPYNNQWGHLAGGYIVFRYYAPWGDGTPDGWQIPVNTPDVICNGMNPKTELWFASDSARVL